MSQLLPLTPEDKRLASLLEATAQPIQPSPAFQSALEKRLEEAFHSRPQPTRFWREAGLALGGAVALLALALLLNWIIRSFVPVPEPAAGGTPTPALPGEPTLSTAVISPPSGEIYDWRGTPLTLQTNLPNGPAEAFVFAYQPETPATLESARALAAQFGMNGTVYTAGGPPQSPSFLIVEGDQWLYVHSDQHFQYYPDYPRFTAAINGGTPPANAEALIGEFMASHGFDFDYRLAPSEMYGGLLAAPLTPDGNIICYEYFQCAGLRFTLDEEGILSMDGILPTYAPLGQYGIISAEEAFQQILEANGGAGMLEGMTSPSGPIQTWLRPHPLDETITLFGWMTSIPSAEGSAPLITLDGYTMTGNTAGIPADFGNAFVEATGQFHETDGLRTFELESWKVYDGYEDGLLGAISLQNGQVILNTADEEIFVLPDASDLPLPLDNVFVIGVRQGDLFEWKSVDLRNLMGGGGGGGGGSGFYQLNLTGTPVPFPTPEARPEGSGGGGAVEAYLVQAGDTINSIAAANGITPKELMQLNEMTDPSKLQIGQTLVIRSEAMSLPQTVEGLRGLMSITIYIQADGSQRVDYGFINESVPFPYLLLESENLEGLQEYQSRPIDVWGTIEMKEGQPVLKVERYQIPFPDLGFQILRGTQQSVMLEGQPTTLFTTDEGTTYVQFAPYGGLDGSMVGKETDEILIEALIIPGEALGGYPALRIFSASPAVNTKNGKPLELSVTADQVYTVDLAGEGEWTPPTAAIERVQLVYYMPDPRYKTGALNPDEKYLQPAWLFTGHYSDGTEFFILVQALKMDFLLPETAPFTAPG
ncbi:MAG: LysM peptidoglycan-binding domain-containing protein [Chloroflexota bacterium]